jgi:N6-adenosine-specific RNA methylase IME4
MTAAAVPLTYPTMHLDAIRALPVSDLAAAASHLYLWTIDAYVRAAYDVAAAWGFTPRELLTWCKPPRGIGPGGTFAHTSEFVLFAKRGGAPALRRVETTWFEWPRGAHSVKPEAFLDLVESVSPGPYLELFARRQRLGWDTWGNEALEHVSLDSKRADRLGSALG